MSFVRDGFGFATSYRIEIDPELPADGAWEIPFFAFGRGGALNVRISPQVGQPWVASFELRSTGLLNGLYASPAPNRFVVLTGIDAFLLDASKPGAAEKLPIAPTVAVARPVGTDLLLVGSFTDVAALDAGGLRWATRELFMDDLEFASGPAGRIFVQGSRHSIPGDPQKIELDTKSGRVIGTP